MPKYSFAHKRSPPTRRAQYFLVTLTELAYGLRIKAKSRREVRRRMAGCGFTVTHLKEEPVASHRVRQRRNHVRQAQ